MQQNTVIVINKECSLFSINESNIHEVITSDKICIRDYYQKF